DVLRWAGERLDRSTDAVVVVAAGDSEGAAIVLRRDGEALAYARISGGDLEALDVAAVGAIDVLATGAGDPALESLLARAAGRLPAPWQVLNRSGSTSAAAAVV